MKRIILAAALAALPITASADWVLSAADSKLSFGSVKKDEIGEVHQFTSLTGAVDAAGTATVTIDLSSVETMIDIRNERMAEFVFDGIANPVVTAGIDLDALSSLATGEMQIIDMEGSLAFGNAEIAIEAPLAVIRLGEARVLVTTADMIFVNVADLGLTEGIDKLMELAELPSITRVVPVTFRLVFDEVTGAAAAPASASAVAAVITDSGALETAPAATATDTAALTGDVEAGAKVFRKCGACHVADEEKNRVGPHLVGIIGRQAATIEDYKYSNAFQKLDYEWTPERLTEYLRDPKGYVKGTKMSFGGLKDDEDIANVLAYLASAK